MRTPGFWRRGGARWPGLLLAPFGLVYGAATLARMRRAGTRLGVPVISVGNFTAGGGGKTPAVLAIAAALRAKGESPFVVTRGYGGREAGPLRVDPSRHRAEAVGDEPLLLARSLPVIVARDRAAGGRLAVEEGASVVILDDALQNPHLSKDLSIAVIDGRFGFGNGRIVPAGPLRAPLAGMLEHVDHLIRVGADEANIGAALTGRAIAAARLVPEPEAAARLAEKPVIAFCGIALPEKFEATLREAAARLIAARHFPDHHPYSDAEAEALIALAAREGALLVTTEKDHIRLWGTPALERLAEAAVVLPVSLALAAETVEAVYRAVEAARRR